MRAWAGTRNTVSRAMQLISEAGLEDGGVEALAARLGVGSRHLRRLFLKHLGATPIAVAQTRRLHFAKKLIDETRLPMGQVALAAGFGSVRRFNAAIRKVYHRTPTHIRHIARRIATGPENQYIFRLHYRPPYNWRRVLEFLAPRAIPGVEVVTAGVYRRTISINEHHGYFEVSHNENDHALAVRVQFSDPRSLFLIIERVRAMFDLDADWPVIVGTLNADLALAARLEAEAGLRVPGSWSGLEMTTRAILGQQVTVKAATTLAGRLVAAHGRQLDPVAGLTHLFPDARTLASADLTKIGLTSARAESVSALARAVSERKIQFEAIADYDDFRARLCAIPGIGKWTAEYVAMRVLRDPDALPSSDLGLRRAMGDCTARELEARSEAWRPWRAYAAMLLWQTFREESAVTPISRAPVSFRRPTQAREAKPLFVKRKAVRR